METLTLNDKYIVIKNQGTVSLFDIPAIPYNTFLSEIVELLQNDQNHCVAYYAYPAKDKLKFICCIADDKAGGILVFSHEQPLRKGIQLNSITKDIYAFHIFEREI